MASSKPLVSIALCTFNGEKFLREQLNSLINQSYPNIEIIVVDDLSTDHTLPILEEYSTKYPSIKVFQNETNLGFHKNFEKALSYTTGDYIALSDQDDIWHTDKIKILIEGIGSNVLMYHDSAFIDDQGKSLNKSFSDIMNLYSGNQCHHFLLENCIAGHSCFFKRSLLVDLLPFPSVPYHDKWIGFVASSRGNIDYHREPLVKYRQHSASTTDILRVKKIRKKSGIMKIRELTEEIKILRAFLPDDPFMNKFYDLLVKRMNQYLSVELFLFVFKNRNVLYYFKKRSPISKFSYCLKFLWGYRLKVLLDNQKQEDNNLC